MSPPMNTGLAAPSSTSGPVRAGAGPTRRASAGEALPPPPYFDAEAMRVELTALFAAHDSAEGRRAAVVERLKQLVKTARAAACAQLEADGNGRQCASGLSHFQDSLIRLLYAYTTTHIYQSRNPSDAERMAIVATGGYGRGLLAPGSDVDLLFLLPYKQTPWGESVAEHLLYVLWDLGFKVGHATRTVEQSIKLALADTTIRTSLIDMRLIEGDGQLYEELVQRLKAEVIRGTGRQFIAAKLAERDERHRRAGESRYRVEPDIKEGKGGLRDLHTLYWLAKYTSGADLATGEGTGGVLTPAEVAMFRRCEDFLWAVRCHLHFLTGRPEERLSFDVQPSMAQRLGYRAAGGMLPVERFMKHYFLVAKDVGDLTAILCSTLEMQQLMTAPRINRLLNPLTWTMRRKVRQRTEFRIDNERLNVSDDKVFERDPVNLLRIFAVAEEMSTYLHPNAMRLIRSSLRLIDDKVRSDAEANRIFLDLLERTAEPDKMLRMMNEAGVLGRFLPEFGRVVAMMQFNMYHHYTVDEHLVRTVGEIKRIGDGKFAETLPLSTEIFSSVINKRALLVAALLHDAGKGRKEDHSIVGERIARALCPRLGLSPAETETCAWLIREHLTMSEIAQSRDIGDPKTISDFAAVVQSPERLKLLLLLTVADIRAVGPGTWNGWKGQLLRQLYWETEPLVAGGHTLAGRKDRIQAAQHALRPELPDWPLEDVERFIARHYDDYWLKTDVRRMADHARLMARAERDGLKLATDCASSAFTSITELTVLAPNHPRLLSLFAGACAVAGANIVGAHISTTRDGMALDTFLLQRELTEDEDEQRRVRRITQIIDEVLNGKVRLAQLMARRKAPERRIVAFHVEPVVVINNEVSDRFTVIEATGRDRPGLLYDLTSTLSDLSLDITSAHITTYGEKAVDVFYVTDLTNKKIVTGSRQTAIRQRLSHVLGPQEGAALVAKS
jgi:[protein-PII] uridylyltransferase